MRAEHANALAPRWKETLNLSLRHAPEVYESADEVGNVPHAGALRTTLDDLGASVVFCVQNVPTVVIVSVDEYNAGRTAELHEALWNQGLATLLLVISGDIVRAFSLARLPRRDSDEEFRLNCLVDTLHAVTDALALRNLLYGAESGRYWKENGDYFRPEERVDRVLLANLTQSHGLLRGKDGEDLPNDAAQALLIQTMFVAYLEDREIIGQEYFRVASDAKQPTFEALLRTGNVESLATLFRHLREEFNGDLFVAPCSFNANDRTPKLRRSHLEILARFRAGNEEMRGASGQYRLWSYNFKYMPVELISAVHDQFLNERTDRRSQGAYYTPMFLADIVIARVWERISHEARERGVFLDPACGSGIFLVRLFQRLCEQGRIDRSGSELTWNELVEILSRLRGTDVDGSAVRMAVFSLYVALLEKVRPPAIRELINRGERLPKLYGRRVSQQDFFEIPADQAKVDVVVGNPPWASRRPADVPALAWCRREGVPAPSREVAWAFVWKSLRHLREGGVVGLLVPAMGFLHNHAKYAVEARRRLVRESRAYAVVNFADMRRQLFGQAVRSAALLVLGRGPLEYQPYRFDYFSPKVDPNFTSRRLITLGSADRCRLDSRAAEDDPFLFKKRLWMSEPEARLFNYLSHFPRLGDVAVKFRRRRTSDDLDGKRWVIGQGFKPAVADRQSDPTYDQEYSDSVASLPHLPTRRFRVLAETGENLRPCEDGMVHRRGFERGFEGPRVMIPGGLATAAGRCRLRAAYVDAPLTFRHAIQAVVVPPEDARRAMLLSALLNSKVMLWFIFHGTSSFGAERPLVRMDDLLRLPFPRPGQTPEPERARLAVEGLVGAVEDRLRGGAARLEELLEEIDRLALEFFCISEEERILVEDTVDQVIPAVQPTGSASLWESATAGERYTYAETLVEKLGTSFDEDCSIGARLVAHNGDLAVLELSLHDTPVSFQYGEHDDEEVGTALSRLQERLGDPLASNFQATPDVRVFDERRLFLVKPLARRFWLRSAALADAGAIAIDLHMVVGKSRGRGAN